MVSIFHGGQTEQCVKRIAVPNWHCCTNVLKNINFKSPLIINMVRRDAVAQLVEHPSKVPGPGANLVTWAQLT